MAATNPLLQSGDGVWVVERIIGESPILYRGTILHIYYDDVNMVYRYKISRPKGEIELPETLYGITINHWFHTGYNNMRDVFKDLIDAMYPL